MENKKAMEQFTSLRLSPQCTTKQIPEESNKNISDCFNAFYNSIEMRWVEGFYWFTFSPK